MGLGDVEAIDMGTVLLQGDDMGRWVCAMRGLQFRASRPTIAEYSVR